MVHVVSMLEVPTVEGSASHQSNDVSGEQYSAFVFCWWAKTEENASKQQRTSLPRDALYMRLPLQIFS